MATTTNFGWETPDDTDLVKDGAAAIRTLGSAIDTSLVDLKGGTTGQVLSKASNTDLDFTWSSVDPLTILDAKGDLITATAADTPSRLAVGTNGQYLSADSSTATGLKWVTPTSGALTLIERATFTTTTSVITGAVFSATYDNYLVILNINSSAASNWSHKWRMRNGTNTTTAGYTFGMNTADEGGNVSGYGESNSAAWDLTFGNSTVGGFYRFEIGNPNASQYTHLVGQLTRPGGTTSITARHFGGFLNDTNSYDKLDILFAQNSSGYYAVYGYGK